MNKMRETFNTEEEAKEYAERYGGTVVQESLESLGHHWGREPYWYVYPIKEKSVKGCFEYVRKGAEALVEENPELVDAITEAGTKL